MESAARYRNRLQSDSVAFLFSGVLHFLFLALLPLAISDNLTYSTCPLANIPVLASVKNQREREQHSRKN